MKKSLFVLLFAALLFALSPALMAQSEGSKADMASETTLTGCLSAESQGEGNTHLTLQDGFQVKVAGSAELKNHDGHKVEVTGKWQNKNNEKVFHVSDIKHISADCG